MRKSHYIVLSLLAIGAILAMPSPKTAFAQEEYNMQNTLPDEGDEDTNIMPLPTPEVQSHAAKKNSPAKKPLQTVPQFNTVILRGLNKVTARSMTIDAPLGSVVRFGTIEIVAHRCWKSNPEERLEEAALLEISEIKPAEPPQQIFFGWMYASSPTLSALEHPFYDVTMVRCAQEKVKS